MDRHKIFLYKEDFNKFLKGLNETVDHVKTELMPDFDFDAFNHDTPYEGDESQTSNTETTESFNHTTTDTSESSESASSIDNGSNEEVDKW